LIIVVEPGDDRTAKEVECVLRAKDNGDVRAMLIAKAMGLLYAMKRQEMFIVLDELKRYLPKKCNACEEKLFSKASEKGSRADDFAVLTKSFVGFTSKISIYNNLIYNHQSSENWARCSSRFHNEEVQYECLHTIVSFGRFQMCFLFFYGVFASAVMECWSLFQ
jgi:hypothetical protein